MERDCFVPRNDMARTIVAIQQEIFDGIAANENLAGLTSQSKAAIWRLMVFVVAFSIWLLETLFDQHKKEIDTAIYEQKSGTSRWYRNMSLAFQYGIDLIADSDQFETGYTFDNETVKYTDSQIEASKIIKYCSVKESTEISSLTIKVAGESADGLEPLSEEQLESFAQYLNEIKYAGVKLNVVNNPADQLVLVMQIYRDVLVLDSTGSSIKLGGKPVEAAIKTYMKNLPFDGELVLNDLIEKLRALDGVNNVNIINASSSHWDSVAETHTNFMSINVKRIPESGYYEVGSLNNIGAFEAGNFNSVTYVV